MDSKGGKSFRSSADQTVREENNQDQNKKQNQNQKQTKTEVDPMVEMTSAKKMVKEGEVEDEGGVAAVVHRFYKPPQCSLDLVLKTM